MKKSIIFLILITLIGCTCLPQIPTQFLPADNNCEVVIPNYLQYFNIKDNCPGAVLTQDPLPGFVLTADNPYKQVTILATDISGNTDKETFDVILSDTIPPEIILIDSSLLSYNKIPLIEGTKLVAINSKWGAYADLDDHVLIADSSKLIEFGFSTPQKDTVITPFVIDAGINDHKFCKQESGAVHYNYAFTPGLGKMYKSERFGDFNYRLLVGKGKYEVELHFAEIDFEQLGKRVFDVKIEDDWVLNGFDILSEVLPKNPLVKIYVTNVTDEWLDIKFISKVDNAKVSGIVVNKI